jgi:hypothetical protein
LFQPEGRKKIMATTNRPQSREETRRETNQGMRDMKHEGEHAASGMTERMKEAGSSARDTAKDTASSVADTMGEWASSAGEKVEGAVSAMGSGMKSLGGTIRENAPHEGMLASAASTLASTLESGGRYLQKEGLGGACHELAGVIRRNPIPAMFIGIGLGFLLARATRS